VTIAPHGRFLPRLGPPVLAHAGAGGAFFLFGMSIGGGSTIGEQRMAVFLDGLQQKGIEIKDLASRIRNPIQFKPPGGGRIAYGYEATILADLCDVILAARKHLHPVAQDFQFSRCLNGAFSSERGQLLVLKTRVIVDFSWFRLQSSRAHHFIFNYLIFNHFSLGCPAWLPIEFLTLFPRGRIQRADERDELLHRGRALEPFAL
jgi:hypothetical protein